MNLLFICLILLFMSHEQCNQALDLKKKKKAENVEQSKCKRKRGLRKWGEGERKS